MRLPAPLLAISFKRVIFKYHGLCSEKRDGWCEILEQLVVREQGLYQLYNTQTFYSTKAGNHVNLQQLFIYYFIGSYIIHLDKCFP